MNTPYDQEPQMTLGANVGAPVAAARTSEALDVAELVRVLVLAADRYRAVESKLLGIHLSEFTALGHLRHAGRATPGDLAVRLGITTAAVTALLDRLERRDMVRRRPNPADRRSLLVALTTTGATAYDCIFDELGDITSAAVSGLAETEAAAVRHFLRQVASSLVVRTSATVERIGRPAARLGAQTRRHRDSPRALL
jgi:DNA-binding MarR family transcriptional regulator